MISGVVISSIRENKVYLEWLSEDAGEAQNYIKNC